jgi:hypothetical protein
MASAIQQARLLSIQCQLEALVTQREAMILHDQQAESLGTATYRESEYIKLADRMRALAPNPSEYN